MQKLLLGNIIALIASFIMVYSGLLKTKKRVLYAQTIQIGLFVISNMILGWIVGVIVNIINVTIFCIIRFIR